MFIIHHSTHRHKAETGGAGENGKLSSYPQSHDSQQTNQQRAEPAGGVSRVLCLDFYRFSFSQIDANVQQVSGKSQSGSTSDRRCYSRGYRRTAFLPCQIR